jgi:hypothetical protein
MKARNNQDTRDNNQIRNNNQDTIIKQERIPITKHKSEESLVIGPFDFVQGQS